MRLVDAVEAEMGPAETWPSSIIAILFAFNPYRQVAVTHLTKVIAFFYGNNLPLNLACQFFSACSYLLFSLVIHRFTYLYDLFTQHSSQSRCLYYDLG